MSRTDPSDTLVKDGGVTRSASSEAHSCRKLKDQQWTHCRRRHCRWWRALKIRRQCQTDRRAKICHRLPFCCTTIFFLLSLPFCCTAIFYFLSLPSCLYVSIVLTSNKLWRPLEIYLVILLQNLVIN